MGTELLVGLLLVSSLNLQPAATAFPVAYAAEPVQPLVEIPPQVILDVAPQILPILEKVA